MRKSTAARPLPVMVAVGVAIAAGVLSGWHLVSRLDRETETCRESVLARWNGDRQALESIGERIARGEIDPTSDALAAVRPASYETVVWRPVGTTPADSPAEIRIPVARAGRSIGELVASPSYRALLEATGGAHRSRTRVAIVGPNGTVLSESAPRHSGRTCGRTVSVDLGLDRAVLEIEHPDDGQGAALAVLGLSVALPPLAILGLSAALRRRSDRIRVELEARLAQAEKMSTLGLVTASVAHDLAGPASFVQANIEHLGAAVEQCRSLVAGRGRLAASAFEDARSILDDCLDGTQRIHELVKQIKDFVRPGHAASEPSDVDREVERALRLVGATIRHRIVVERRLASGRTALVPPGELQQVLVNLLVNASQAIEDQGWIRIETESDDELVRIRVADSGRGIPPEVLPRLFEPFFTTKPPGEGTGLGLSICRDLVERRGGAIDVSSEPGRGTVVEIQLKAAAGAPSTPPAAADRRSPLVAGTT